MAGPLFFDPASRSRTNLRAVNTAPLSNNRMSGLDLGGAINASADWLCSAPIIRGIVGNPIVTALLITALAAIVVMAVYSHQIKQAGAKCAVRALLYVFLLVTAVIFVHHYAVTCLAQETVQQKGVRDVFSSIQQSREVGGAVPVYPMGASGGAAAAAYMGAGAYLDDCAATSSLLSSAGRPDNVAFNIDDVVIPARPYPGNNAGRSAEP